MDRIISFHLGASSFSLSTIREDRTVESGYFSLKGESPDSVKYADVLNEMVTLILSLDRPQECAAVVVTTPAPIDRHSGLIRVAPSRPDLHQRPLVADLESRLREALYVKMPVLLENDANAAGLRSHRFGLGQDKTDFIHIRVSTGIGSALFLRGALYEGQRSLAGEIGHIPLKPHGWKCGCGNVGCAETIIGGAAFQRLIRLEDPNDNAARLHFAEVLQGATAPSDASRRVLQDMGFNLGLVIATAVNLIGPQSVLFSGPMFDRFGILFEVAKSEAQERIVSGLACEMRMDDAPGPEGHALTALAVYLDRKDRGGDK